jgi:hypothetical protein
VERNEAASSTRAAPTTDVKSKESLPMNTLAHESHLLAAIREIYSRLPETYYLESWELQHVLSSLGHTDGLVCEAEIATAIEVARTDWTPDEGAA